MSYSIEQLFSTPVYVTQVDKFDSIQEEITSAMETINFEMNPDWGQTHYLSDPTFEEYLLLISFLFSKKK